MSVKRKQQNKKIGQKSPNSCDLVDDGPPSSARRSRRLRGAEVEFNANVLEEMGRERRASRSRSRSATPAFDHKLKISAALTKISAAGSSNSPPNSLPSVGLSANCSNNSPQRARVDFNDSEANDSFGSAGRIGKKKSPGKSVAEKKRKSREGEHKQIAAESDKNDFRNGEEKSKGEGMIQNGEYWEEEEKGENDENKETEPGKRGKEKGTEREQSGDEKEEDEERGKDVHMEEEDEEESGGENEPFSEDEQIDGMDEDGGGAKGGRMTASPKGTDNGNDSKLRDPSDQEEEEEGEIVEDGTDDGSGCNGKITKRHLDETHNDSEIGDSDEDNVVADEEEDEEEQEKGEESGYEEDIEDPKLVQQKRGKLPKSVVDDKFFNLAEMNAFLDAEDKKAESKMQQRNGRNLGQIENADELEQMISAHERTNLQPRDWALSGEVKAEERPKDALLEQFVDADYRMAAPPTIDAEKTAQLEAMITKRIKDGLFDDVVRKVRVNESLQPPAPYRNATVIGTTEQKVRKSLAEVYGDKFSAGINDNDEFGEEGKKELQQSKLDPVVEAIKSDLDALFLKLDALSHFQFRPQPIQEEAKIVNNMPSLHMEEVGPQAAVGPEVNLLAPEEVKRRVKSAPKAADERTETDRKRQRRQKKKKQRILASIGAMNDEGTDGGEAAERVKSKKKIRRVKFNFAEQINNLVQNNGQQQAKKKRKKQKMFGRSAEEKKFKKSKEVGGEEE